MIRVGVLGAGGRMGREVCRAVHADPGLALVAAVDPPFEGQALSAVAGFHATADAPLVVAGAPEALLEGRAEVVVDFTLPSSVLDNIRWCVEHGLHVVVGTTGLSADDLDDVRTLVERADGQSNVFVAPNFAIGAVLMMRFAELAAAWLPDAEIVELHHPGKRDAPSGTALATADAIARGRRSGGPGAQAAATPPARGVTREGVHVHSVRLPGLVAHQEVLLGGPGQLLTIRHDSTDRVSFMPGVLLAVKEVGRHPGLTVGLGRLLGLP